METKNGRASNGKFAEGNPGGPGRPRRDTERAYLAGLAEVCSLDDWREVCRRAVAEALGLAGARGGVAQKRQELPAAEALGLETLP